MKIKIGNFDCTELAKEARNAAKDPADYFEYIMFAWGNCQAGDRLVMERKLKRFPNEKDLSEDFTPGVRFFFDYKKLCTHPNAVFEGVLPLKIKDEVILKDWIHAIVVPENEKSHSAEPCAKSPLCKKRLQGHLGLVRKSVRVYKNDLIFFK